MMTDKRWAETGTERLPNDERMLKLFRPLAEAAFPKDTERRVDLVPEVGPFGSLFGDVRGQVEDGLGGNHVELREAMGPAKFGYTLFHEMAHTVGYEHGPEMDAAVEAALHSQLGAMAPTYRDELVEAYRRALWQDFDDNGGKF
jgi:hypothetical protein